MPTVLFLCEHLQIWVLKVIDCALVGRSIAVGFMA